MDKIREVMSRKISIKRAMFFTVGLWIVLSWIVPLAIDVRLFRNLFIGAVTMLLASTMIQLIFSRKKEKEITPLRYLQHMENSLSDLFDASRLLWYELQKYKRIILYLILLYVTANAAGPWALDTWGGNIKR